MSVDDLECRLTTPSHTQACLGVVGVSRNTIIAAYDLLLSEGYVNGRVGSGNYVTDAARHRPASGRTPVPQSDFAHCAKLASSACAYGAFPAGEDQVRLQVWASGRQTIPASTWQRLSARALRQAIRSGELAGPPEGLDVLREAITNHISFSRAVACRPDDVVVTNGSQQGFSLAQLFVRPGKTVVAVENRGYPPARLAFSALGAKVRPVPVDAEGMVVSGCQGTPTSSLSHLRTNRPSA